MSRRRRYSSSDTVYERNPRQRTRSWGEFIGQSAAGVAGATLGFMEAGLPGAVIRGEQVYEAAAPNLDDGYDLKVAGKNIMSTYAGKFNLMPPKAGSYESICEEFANKGSLVHNEYFGRIDDPDCVYLGHTTMNIGLITYSIACALVRKLLKKAGFNPTSSLDVIPFMSNLSSGSNDWKFCWTTNNTDGTINEYWYRIPSNASLQTIIAASPFIDTINRLVTITTGEEVVKQFTLENLYLRVGPGEDAVGILMSNLNLNNEQIEVWMHSTYVIQNRTLSAGGSTDITQVSSQPLSGYRYYFRNAVPYPRKKDCVPFLNSTSNQGLILQRAAQGLPAQQWAEPPVGTEFSNCVSYSKVMIQPGEMKKSKISYSMKGHFKDLVRKLYSHNNTDLVYTAMNNIHLAPGRAEVFAFEELMETGSSVKIECAFERQYTCGVLLKTDDKTTMLHDNGKYEFNNLTPVE